MPAERSTTARIAVAVIALALLAAALWQLAAQSAGLVVTRADLDHTPLTGYALPGDEARPVVVVAHGFAGSQQLMQPFATTLARAGWRVVTFDFPGHGRSARALSGGLDDIGAMQRDLVGTLDRVVAHARTLPGADGRVAVLGHSMAADVVVRWAHDRDDLLATVAVSLFLPTVEDFDPPNLLIVDGALEPAMLREQGRQIVGAPFGVLAEPGRTYGRFDDGSARRVAYARGVEHIGVLYSVDAQTEAVAWLDAALGRSPVAPAVDRRGPWIGVLFAAVLLLAWPLASLLPRLAPAEPMVAQVPWRLVLPVAILPALFTPLALVHAPEHLLPLMLGDYLVLHFALYGVMTVAGLLWLRLRVPAHPPLGVAPWRLAAVAAVVGAYGLFAFALPLDQWVFSTFSGAWRLLLVAALMAGTLPWFIADEWFTRRLAGRRGVYALTKACFLFSLALATALNLERLFFLVIIVPAILLLFVVYGLISRWVHNATGHPLVAAIAHAFVFAWLIAMTFPVIVAR
jgi:pimeloyl-ACP methyl ester carboxylesterase